MNGIRFGSPAREFAIAGAGLLLLSGLTWHSDWPPMNWRYTHFSSGELGHEILLVSVLFLLMAFLYFIAPKLLRRGMNKLLGQLHFWTSLIGFFLLLALPIALNLTFRHRARESIFERFVRTWSTGMKSSLWADVAILAAQLFFIANLVWSILKGEKTAGPAKQRVEPLS